METSGSSHSLLTEIIIIVALVLVNGVFAMAEMALVSARKTRLRELSDNGDAGARAALLVREEPNRFLSIIQVGISLVGILAGVFGGATIAERISAVLRTMPLLAPYSSGLGIAIVVVGITYLSLVLGELVPKRVALGNAERLAALSAPPLRAASALVAPIIGLLSLSTNAVLLAFRVRSRHEATVTEDEVKIIVNECTAAGVFEKGEQEIVNRVLSLGDRKVNDLMTPRPEMVALDVDAEEEENWRKISASGHSQFPVYRHDPDNVLGIVSVKSLWKRMVGREKVDLPALLARPLFVPEGLPALALLESFKQSRTHVALVVDEYVLVQGIVTDHDILEATVCELPFVEMEGEPEAIRREDGSWLVDALLPAEKFREIFGLDITAGGEANAYHTIGGFMLLRFGRLPSAGARFSWNGWFFEVVDMDGHRIDKVLVRPVQEERPAREA